MLEFEKGESHRRELHVARGVALDAHAGFEQLLLEVFAHLMDTNLKFGGIVFFRLTNAGLRNRILEDLIAAKFKGRFDLFWFGTPKQDGLMKLIRQVDQRRNEIVHWKSVFSISGTTFELTPPNVWNETGRPNRITVDDIYEFTAKCDCLRHYAGNFNWRTTIYREGENSDKSRAWLDRFDQPPSYPPDEDHPLFKIWTESRTRRPHPRS